MSAFRILSALVILSSVACGGGGGGGATPTNPPSPPPSNIVTVDILDNRFEPKQVRIDPGITVRWVLRGDATNHTTTAVEMAWSSGLVFMNPGDTFEHTFTEADRDKTFEYSCVTHETCCQMRGSVQVGDSAPAPSEGY